MAPPSLAPRSDPPLLKGELFKQSKESWSDFKLRWFALHSDGELRWSESVDVAAKGSLAVRGASVRLDPFPIPPSKKDEAPRWALRICPPAGQAKGKTYTLATTSPEERQLWAGAIDRAAHPDVTRSDVTAM